MSKREQKEVGIFSEGAGLLSQCYHICIINMIRGFFFFILNHHGYRQYYVISWYQRLSEVSVSSYQLVEMHFDL